MKIPHIAPSFTPRARARLAARFLPWGILVGGSALSAAMWISSHRQAGVIADQQTRFELARVVTAVEDEVHADEQILRGVAALFDASESVLRDEFRAYVKTLHLESRYTGIQGVGFSRFVRADERAAHVASVRAEGFPTYDVKPPGVRDAYTAIVFLEPFDWRNQRAFGYDMWSEPVRHAAMERACDAGEPSLSGKVKLVQETETDVQAGTLLYVPVYTKGASPTTPSERRARLLGWAYSPLRMNDLVGSVVRRGFPTLGERVTLSIYDGDGVDPDTQLFRLQGASPPAPDGATTRQTLEIAGRSWTFAVRPVARAAQDNGAQKERIVGVGGLLITLLLTAFAATVVRNRENLEATLGELRLATDELDVHRRHLETLVDERTRELSLAKDAAEAANRAKDAFLANMSHEIRTPLNAVTGMSYLLRQGGVTDKQRERLDRIDEAVRHLLAVVDDILEISKIEAGKFDVARRPVDVGAVVDGVAAMIAPEAERRGLVVRVEKRGLPRALLGDETRLKQALLNYANNAVKFTGKGEVVIEARVASEGDAEVELRFAVTDTGIGIAEDVLPRLFTRFEQADTSTTRKYGGTGLGLAIAKKQAEIMGGTAGVESIAGVGSTFWFTARLAKTASQLAAPEPAAAPSGAPKRGEGRVLVVEDDPTSREIALELLGDAGLSVDVATNGAEAVQKAEKGGYDLILMDVQMPVMDGLAATRELRASPVTRLVPILAMTADAFDEDRKQCLDAGMDDFISKPFDPDALVAMTLRWLPTGRAARDA